MYNNQLEGQSNIMNVFRIQVIAPVQNFPFLTIENGLDGKFWTLSITMTDKNLWGKKDLLFPDTVNCGVPWACR